MNTEFNESEVILGRLSNNKVVPLLIIKSNSTLFGLRLYKYNSRHKSTSSKKQKDNYEIIIHRSEGLRFTSVVNIEHKIPLNRIEKIKLLFHLKEEKYQTIINYHNDFLREKYQQYTNSRKKIKNITSNIEVNAINNEKYVVQGKKGRPDRIGPKSSLNYTQPVHTPYITVYRGAYS